MTFNLLLSLSITLTLVAAAPGPGVIMTVTRTLQFGLTAGLLVVAGIVAMDLVVLMATLAGLNLLTLANQPGVLTLVLGAYALLTAKLKTWLFEQHPERQLWLNRISATVLFILAITLIHSTIS